MMTVLA